MTRAELWAIFTKRNPSMGGPDETHITLTARGLRKIFEQAYDQGHDAGFANGKAWEKAERAKVDKATGGLFDEFFGKGAKP